MKNIVLLTRKNNEKVTHVSFSLYNNFVEAQLFCFFINSLSLKNDEKLIARIVTVNTEYSLEKYETFSFDDFAHIDDSMTQKVMRDIDSEILVIALTNAKDKVKDKFFNNMSKRAVSMIKEDMEYNGLTDEIEINIARQKMLSIYNSLITERFNELVFICENLKKEYKEKSVMIDGRDNIVVVFQGLEADKNIKSVTVFLYETYKQADRFCDFINELKPDKGIFLYARHVDQMIEYETCQKRLKIMNAKDRVAKKFDQGKYLTETFLKD